MALDVIAAKTREPYYIEERRRAIRTVDFPGEMKDIVDCLDNFELLRK